MSDFLQQLPKAELHCHIEGTLEPELLWELAARNGVPLPFRGADEVRQAYRFHDLASFLAVYEHGAHVLRAERDFADLTAAYLTRAHADGARHVEIFCDLQAHLARGVPVAAIVGGIHTALGAARRDLGLSAGLILCFLRDRPLAEAEAAFDLAGPWLGVIDGIGLDSNERGHPPGRFADLFARARALGLHCVAHAGEEGPPSYIAEALDALRAERIDHGVRAEEDPALLARLVREGVPLTVCPVSNVRLGVVPTLAQHNLRRLLERGVRVTINSDDPAYFGAYLLDNYRAVQTALALSRAQLISLAANSLAAAFVGEHRRRELLGTLAVFIEQYGFSS